MIFVWLGPRDEVEHGDEVANTAAENEDVPDGVTVFDPIHRVEEDTGRVGDAAGDDPRERGLWQVAEDFLPAEDADPTHADVGEGGGGLEAVDKKDFEDDAGDGDGPHGREHDPACYCANADD